MEELTSYINFYPYTTDNQLPSTIKPIEHFIQEGFKNHYYFRVVLPVDKRRMYLEYFDWEYYLLANKITDVYIYRRDRAIYNWINGPVVPVRYWCPRPTLERLKDNFDGLYYHQSYPDTINTGLTAWEHFYQFGRHEDRHFRLIRPFEQLELLCYCFDSRYYALDTQLYSSPVKALEDFLKNPTRPYRLHHLERYLVSQIFPTETIKAPAILVDLCPWRTSGLMNQLYAFYNARMLSEKTGRNLAVLGFYPDYDKAYMIPISEVLATKVTHGDLLREPWQKLKYTMKSHGNFEELLSVISPDRSPYVYIEDAFSGYMLEYYREKKNQQLYLSYLCQIQFHHRFQVLCQTIKDRLKLDHYSSVHLRLEDDVILLKKSPKKDYINWLYQQYCEKMRRLKGSIYISTGLQKSENKYNQLLDDLKRIFPQIQYLKERAVTDFAGGRELDAIIDYMLCKESDYFIGFCASTFTQLLMKLKVGRSECIQN